MTVLVDLLQGVLLRTAASEGQQGDVEDWDGREGNVTYHTSPFGRATVTTGNYVTGEHVYTHTHTHTILSRTDYKADGESSRSPELSVFCSNNTSCAIRSYSQQYPNVQ